MGPIIKDQPVLCADLVRFAGDAVALVAAETEQAAEIAVERIEVDYEELPAVTDPLEALEPGAVVAHEGGNIGTHTKVRRGDIEAAFRDAAAVVEAVHEGEELGDDAVVFTPGIFRDGEGHDLTPYESVEVMAAASSAPVYGPFSTFIGSGIVGGYMTPYEQQAKEAGAIVVRLD